MCLVLVHDNDRVLAGQPLLVLTSRDLEERLARARRENWGHEMTGSIAAELDTTTGQLAQASCRCKAEI